MGATLKGKNLLQHKTMINEKNIFYIGGLSLLQIFSLGTYVMHMSPYYDPDKGRGVGLLLKGKNKLPEGTFSSFQSSLMIKGGEYIFKWSFSVTNNFPYAHACCVISPKPIVNTLHIFQDFLNLDMERYQYGGVNITGFQLVNYSSSFIKDFLGTWNTLEPGIYPGAAYNSIPVRIKTLSSPSLWNGFFHLRIRSRPLMQIRVSVRNE